MPHAWPALAACLLLLLTACGRQKSSAEFDGTRSQILWRLFDNLARGESEQVLRDISRLRALTKPSRFYELAEEQEQLRVRLIKGKADLEDGRIDTAVAHLRRLRQRYPNRPMVQQALDGALALDALQDADRCLPAAWAEEQRRILARLHPHADRLAASPAFRGWYAAQQERLEYLIGREQKEARRQLRSELDLALVSHPDVAPLVLAQLVAVDDDAAATLATAAGEPSTTDNVEAQTPLPLATALSLLGSWNPAPMSESNPPHAPTPWRSQQLLSVLNAARQGRWNDAFERLRETGLGSSVHGQYITALTASYLSANRPPDSPPWVIPCPSVPEVLQRIVDVIE